MTFEIGALLAILAVMAFLFFTEKLPIDLTAFLGLAALVLGGYVTPAEAFTGFSSPAVITMLSVFFLSTALLKTGVADMLGERVHRITGSREVPLIAFTMLTAGILSAFMNNVAATAVLLPAVASVARTTGIPPSRLFMPLSFGAILGGTTTLVGTPPNILASDLLRERGLEPFGLFAFTPIGLLLLATGVVYMIAFRRWVLPDGGAAVANDAPRDLLRAYRLQDNLFSIRIPAASGLVRTTLGASDFGRTLDAQVVSIHRSGRELRAHAETVLEAGDVLLVQGRQAELAERFRVQGLRVDDARPGDLTRTGDRVDGLTVALPAGSALVGETLRSLQFRNRFGVVVVGIRRASEVLRCELATEPLAAGDELLLLGTPERLEHLGLRGTFDVVAIGDDFLDAVENRVFVLDVPESSALVGRSLAQSRMSELVGVTVLGIIRSSRTMLAVEPGERIDGRDRLLVTGDRDRIEGLLALGDVELDPETPTRAVDGATLVEATLAPRSAAVGETIESLAFAKRHGLRVLAIWREGRAIHTGLARLKLRFGDALLLSGPWRHIQTLATSPDFVVLAASAREPARRRKAPFALLGLVVLIACVATGYQPIHVAAFIAATFVVLTRAITMEEAYRGVEWRAVFLVAAVLPAGVAMERTGAALLLADGMANVAGPLGPHAVFAALSCLSSALSQCLDGAPAVVLMTPVVVETTAKLGLDARSVMMGISLAASAAFMTPFSHKANLIVMGAGGYRVVDYLRAGTPLTIIVLVLLTLVVPLFFPLR